jgi:predicted membrane protein
MKKIVIGVIIMMLGVFLLFKNLGFIPWDIYHLVLSWQALLIAIGATLVFDRKTDNKNAGVILVLVGTVFLLPKILDVNLSGILIPALIIITGIYFIIRATVKKDSKTFFFERNYENFDKMPFEKTRIGSSGIIHREYVFTGSKEKWTYGKLKDVEIEAVFSGVEVDFTQAELADDVKVAVHIKVTAVFSGVTLYVPEDWNITVQKTGVFGGFVDKRPQHAIRSAGNKLVIMELEAVFGGGEIRCYE